MCVFECATKIKQAREEATACCVKMNEVCGTCVGEKKKKLYFYISFKPTRHLRVGVHSLACHKHLHFFARYLVVHSSTRPHTHTHLHTYTCIHYIELSWVTIKSRSYAPVKLWMTLLCVRHWKCYHYGLSLRFCLRLPVSQLMKVFVWVLFSKQIWSNVARQVRVQRQNASCAKNKAFALWTHVS